jgi:aconitate hydratase
MLDCAGGPVGYLPLDDVFGDRITRVPVITRILLETRLRHGGPAAAEQLLLAMAGGSGTVDFNPSRVISQDHSGVPALADLAALRWAARRNGIDPCVIDSRVPVDLIVDHSVEAHVTGVPDAVRRNLAREYEQNGERYAFLRWAEQAFGNLRVVPPGRGIIHQLHVEHLARIVMTSDRAGVPIAHPDTVVGTDSHTPMVNALGVFGFGVGGMDAEAVMLGQPISLRVAPVIGVYTHGTRVAGVTATDIVLTLTQRLRAHGTVGRFLEFFGPGLDDLGIHDRATLANMCPEYGATCALFPVDDRTLEFLRVSRGDPAAVDLVERYTKAQGLYRSADTARDYGEVIDFDLATVEQCVAGPRRPQDRLRIADVPASVPRGTARTVSAPDRPGDGAVVIAAITSCTNTANPDAMLAAGLLARNAVRRGLRPRPWVKTSLAPGSRVVTRYLADSGLLADLDTLGFGVVGYGCTTCIGNSGPLTEQGRRAADEGHSVAAVLSGNRNFEGRVHPDVRAVYLASPPMVVAWALAGSVLVDLTREPLGHDPDGVPVLLADLWPDPSEVDRLRAGVLRGRFFAEEYSNLFDPPDRWLELPAQTGPLFAWDGDSTYLVEPPFVAQGGAVAGQGDIRGARVLVYAGDSLTTDHISPAGPIPRDSLAAAHLRAAGVPDQRLGSYGGRRGNHDVLVRGTFANPMLRNKLVPGRTGGWTRLLPDGRELRVHDAALAYADRRVPLLVLAGRDYGMGSSRDWAAKGPRLLGVVAVLATGFERIHRSNLVAVGILPVQLPAEPEALGLTGEEEYDLRGLADLTPGGPLRIGVTSPDGRVRTIEAVARIESAGELDCLRHGGVLTKALAGLVGGGNGCLR